MTDNDLFDLAPESDDEFDEHAQEEILSEYIDRLNHGETLDPDLIIAAYPTIGAEIIQQLEVFRGFNRNESGEPLGTLGDYTLRRQIGRGGMGVVYEAWQGSMDRVVALKVLPAGIAADTRACTRFMREAQAAGKLSHQNVVSVHSTGVEEGIPWYSMEFVEGETLAQVLAKVKDAEPEAETPFGPKDQGDYFVRLARAFADVADGLQHAHSKGVTHRDIKPSNLILDGDGRLRILDFGLARLEGQESLTLSGDFVGTPLYMSPEQAKRRKIPIDHRTDVYSLGATMYEALCGRPPFRGKDHQDTLSRIIERDPVEPRKLNARVPNDLQTIVLKCLRKRRCSFPDGSFGPWNQSPLNVASINTVGHEHSPWLSSDGNTLLYLTGQGGPYETLREDTECAEAPLTARRRILTEESIRVHHEERPAWSPGESYRVTIELTDIREPGASCAAPTEVVIEEIVPEGWIPRHPSPCGVITGDATIKWTLRVGECGGAGFPDVLSYQVEAGFEPDLAIFHGTIGERGAGAQFLVEGADRLASKEEFSGGGFIRRWLLLGPYRQAIERCLDAATPGEDLIRADYLTDGKGTTEASVRPRAGDSVDTDYNGAAASVGLAPADTGINPEGVPTWHPWRAEDDTVDFGDYYGADDVDRVMTYAVVYFHVEGDIVEGDIAVSLGLGSDDSVQVLLDGEPIHVNNVGRGAGEKGEVQDPVSIDRLEAGPHWLMVKVFDGCGAHQFRLRFQNTLSDEPLTEEDGITMCLTPEECGFAPVVPPFLRSDTDGSGIVDISDPIFNLTFQFVGGIDDLPCEDAADVDDSGVVDISDPIYNLTFQFVGGVNPPPAPGPLNCGVDPTDDNLTCDSFAACEGKG